MGAKTWMIVFADSSAKDALAASPRLNRDATQRLAETLFPNEKLELIEDGDLSYTSPRDDELHIGAFAGVSVIAAVEFCIDYPSKLDPRFIAAGKDGTITLHAMHSVVDWFAYAIWEKGTLVRSLSLSPDGGILEDIGQHLPFEKPYWSGKHPLVCDEDTHPLPFHPLELGEAALADRFGYQLEGYIDPLLLSPEAIPLLRYKRIRDPWWKFW